MIAFYAIAIFHAEAALDWLRASAPSEGVVYNVALMSAFFLLSMATKFGALWVLGPRPTRWRVLRKAFLAVSFYLIFIGSVASACVLLARHLGSLFETRYWAESQWFWIGLLLFLAFGYVALILKMYGLYRADVLRELRAIPVVSPLFCFAGPKFLLDNIQNFGVPAGDLRINAILMFIAGVLFLACLIGIAFLAPSTGDASSKAQLVLLGGKSSPSARDHSLKKDGLTFGCFAILGVALYLLTLAILDAAARMALATGTAAS